MIPKRFLIPTILTILLLAACSGQPSTPEVQEPPAAAPVESGPLPTQEAAAESAPEATPVTTAEATDCLGGVTSPIGESIVFEYNFTSYEEIISWFCDGAEFEDILVALETESQTGTPAEEMLQMLADGFNWEEIWQLVGLNE